MMEPIFEKCGLCGVALGYAHHGHGVCTQLQGGVGASGLEARKREQLLIDATFEIAIMCQIGSLKADSREKMADYVAGQLRQIGFDTIPMGLSWGVLK